MDLVLLSDNKTLNHELEPLLREAVGSEPIVVTGASLISGTLLPPADVVLVERNTWQQYHALFHYFGVLHFFERATLVSVTRGRRSESLKGRMGRKDFALALPTSVDVARRILDDARELTEQRSSESY